MANTLDAATLQKILNSSAYSQFQGGGEAGGFMSTPTAAFNVDGYNYAPADNGSFYRFQYDPSKGSYADRYAGQQYDAFDGQGNQTGSGNLSQSYGKGSMSDYLPFALVAGGFAPALMGAGAAAGAGAAGNSFDGGLLNSAVMNGVGEGAATTAATVSAPATFNAAADSQLANVAIDAAGGNSLAAYTAAGISPAVASSAISAGVSAADILKYGSLAAATLAGSQGVKTTSDSTRKTDPRVDPYIFGDKTNPGLLNYTQQQLGRDMSPGNLAMLDSMKQKGMGLMNQPVAQNGFGLFTKGRY